MPQKRNHYAHKEPEVRRIGLTVNGQYYQFNVGDEIGEISPTHALSWTLRETLGLTGTKVSCNEGACGSCAIIMDGRAVLSCKVLTIECDKKTIITIEGLADPKTGVLDPLQLAFIEHTAFQCGYCTPGMIMAARAFLNETPNPSEEEIKEALSGNFCRCISHYQVVRAVMSAVEKGK